MNIINLPTELVIKIFINVNYIDIINLSETCKFFYDIITSFSWKQLCIITTQNMPTNIQFLNYFLRQTCNLSRSEIKTFCDNKLLLAKPFTTVIIGRSFINKIFLNYLRRTLCKNVIIIDRTSISGLFNEEHLNFNFYFRYVDSFMTLSKHNPYRINFYEYNLESHVKIFGNDRDYQILYKYKPDSNTSCQNLRGAYYTSNNTPGVFYYNIMYNVNYINYHKYI